MTHKGKLVDRNRISVIEYKIEKNNNLETLNPLQNKENIQEQIFIQDNLEKQKNTDYVANSSFGQPCYYFDIDQSSFIVAEKICKSSNTAIEHISRLKQNGFKSIEYVSSNCVSSWVPSGHYIIHNNLIFDNFYTAEKEAIKLKNDLSNIGLNCSYCKPLMIKAK